MSDSDATPLFRVYEMLAEINYLEKVAADIRRKLPDLYERCWKACSDLDPSLTCDKKKDDVEMAE